MGSAPSRENYRQIVRAPNNQIIQDGKKFVGWNVDEINKGGFFYAFSHAPAHVLQLPSEVFTFTCFRDPVQRIISHYKMLKHLKMTNHNHPCMKEEGPWLGGCLDDFIENIPRNHLYNQIYMFSPKLDIDQAVENISKLDYYLFLERFSEGLAGLSEKLGFNLDPVHLRKAKYQEVFAPSSLEKLRHKLELEYILLDKIRLQPEY